MIDQLTYTKQEAIRVIGCSSLVFTELVREGLIRVNLTNSRRLVILIIQILCFQGCTPVIVGVRWGYGEGIK